MFYFLSKLLLFVIQPLSWVFGLLAVAWWFRRSAWSRRCWQAAIGLAILVTNPLLANLVLRLWEYPQARIADIPEGMQTGVVLGGYLAYSGSPEAYGVTFNEFGNRLHNALEIFGEGKVERLLLSGRFNPDPTRKDSMDNEAVRYLQRIGFPMSSLLVEYRSKNTYENLVFTKKLLEQTEAPSSPFVLLTSAFHMRRAMAIAHRQGLDPIPFPTDHLARPLSWKPTDWLVPSSFALHTWELLLKEWVGYLTYKTMGYA